MTAVTVNGADLAQVLDAALIIHDPDDLPPEVRRCWHALATTAPADAVRLLADLDEDTADALTQVTA